MMFSDLKLWNNPTIGYWSAFNGVEVHFIDHANEKVFCVENAWNGKAKRHKVKLYRDHDRQVCYIILNNTKLYFDSSIVWVR